MQLSQLTVSLEIAKKLKEAGYKQDNSLFYYQGYLHSEGRVELVTKEKLDGDYDFIAAPTAEEFGEQLPFIFVDKFPKAASNTNKKREYSLEIIKYKKYWGCTYTGYDLQEGKTLTDALAKMWLYLKQHQLLQGENATRDN